MATEPKSGADKINLSKKLSLKHNFIPKILTATVDKEVSVKNSRGGENV